MNCDRIAPFYAYLEKAAFGGRLQEHRLAFLNAAEHRTRALVLGDGDGRFTQALMQRYPDLRIDSIEMSAGMVAQAAKRGVRMIQGDALNYPFLERSYDVLFTHFFLDCFATDELERVIGRVSLAATPEACWIISDFRKLDRGWKKLWTGAWLAAMYCFFRFATGLRTRSLFDYQSAIQTAGFVKQREHVSMAGLVGSEWWQRQRSTG